MRARSRWWALVGLVTWLLGLGAFTLPAASAAPEAYFHWQRAAQAQ